MKTDAEKLRDRLVKAEELAFKLCETHCPDCEECPLYTSGRDDACAKADVSYCRRVVKSYFTRQTIRTNVIHAPAPPANPYDPNGKRGPK